MANKSYNHFTSPIFKLIMMHLCGKLGFKFSSAQRYIIKKSAYLVAAHPTRPTNSYAFYVQEKAKNITGTSATNKIKILAEEWKSLSSEQKKVYQDISKVAQEKYAKEKEEYEKQCETPFKTVNGNTLIMSHFASEGIVKHPSVGTITQRMVARSQLVKEEYSKLSTQDKEKFKKEADGIREQRKDTIQKFKFPVKLYCSQLSYSRANSDLDVNLRPKAYRLYLLQWKKEVSAWLRKNKYNLSFGEFLRLYNKDLKAKGSQPVRIVDPKKKVAVKKTEQKKTAKRVPKSNAKTLNEPQVKQTAQQTQ